METFSALLAICAGNSPVTCEFPTQRPVTRSFDVFFDLRLNKRFSKQSWGWWFDTLSRSLWRHCNVSSRVIWRFRHTAQREQMRIIGVSKYKHLLWMRFLIVLFATPFLKAECMPLSEISGQSLTLKINHTISRVIHEIKPKWGPHQPGVFRALSNPGWIRQQWFAKYSIDIHFPRRSISNCLGVFQWGWLRWKESKTGQNRCLSVTWTGSSSWWWYPTRTLSAYIMMS